jgi:hypothetical protein
MRSSRAGLVRILHDLENIHARSMRRVPRTRARLSHISRASIGLDASRPADDDSCANDAGCIRCRQWPHAGKAAPLVHYIIEANAGGLRRIGKPRAG